MDISFYQMGDLYKKQVLLKEFVNTDPTFDIKNSYQTTASMNGPGNGPTTGASDTDRAKFNDSMRFPDDKELSDSEKAELLIKFFKTEIDNGSWKPDTKEVFSNLLDHLLGLDSSDSDSKA
jgi:hypothetical protein